MRGYEINRTVKLILSAVAAVVMAVFISASYIIGENGAGANEVLPSAICFSLIYLVALVILSFAKETDDIVRFGFAALGLATLIFIRVCMVYYQSADYTTFLVNWVESMRKMSVLDVMRTPIGDYNMPYLYILLIISRIPASDLVLIKAVSCLFDVLLAFAVLKCSRLLIKSEKICLLSFILTLAIPTVILNGSMWSQCDSIYAFFIVMTFYFALKKKGTLAIIMFALAFSFKLQAVFLFPAVAACLMSGRIKARHLLFFPATALAAVAPVLVCGRSFADTFSVYFNQTQNYPSLDMNAPTVYRFVFNVSFEHFNTAGIMLAGFGALCLIYMAYEKRDRIDNTSLLMFFYLSMLALPYFLPRMHDRYYFVADVLSLLVFLCNRKLWYVPIINIFSSFVAYAYFLFAGVTVVNYIYLSIALLIMIAVCIRELYRRLRDTAPLKRENGNGKPSKQLGQPAEN